MFGTAALDISIRLMSPISTAAYYVGQMVVTIAIGLGAAVSLTRLCTNLDIYRIQYVKYDILDQFVMLLVVNSVALMVVIIAAVPVLVPPYPPWTPCSSSSSSSATIVNTRRITIILPIGIVCIGTVR